MAKGTSLSQSEKDEFKALRELFAPEKSLATLDEFAKWLFATVATVATLGTGLGVAGFGDLVGDSKDRFAHAVLVAGVSLGFAALARAPLGSRFNPHSVLSMRQKLNRTLKLRYAALTVAALLFAAALVLAATAPLAGTREIKRGTTFVAYAVDAKGKMKASFAVRRAQPFSEVRLWLAGRGMGFGRAVAARGQADSQGNAQLEITAPLRRRARRVALRSSWVDRLGHEVVATTPLPKAAKRR